MKIKLFLGAALVAGTVLSTGGVSFADPPSGSGWDQQPDVVIGGGSDTTYLASQRLEVLYNGAPGCAVVTSESINKGKCADPTATPTGVTNGNYDHDLFVSATPTGSGSGVDALISPPNNQYNPAIDYARSSSGPNATRLAAATYWGYARDAIAVITFGTRSNVCMTQAQLIAIYANPPTITDWSQLQDCNGAALSAGPIIPWSMNTASGTNAVFNAYIAPSSSAVTGRKLFPSGVPPFENDVKPLLADPGPDGVAGNADDDDNNYLWWISYGSWATYPYTKSGVTNEATPVAITTSTVGIPTLNPVAGDPAYTSPSAGSITSGKYGILRTLFHVTRNSQADCRTVGSTTVPTTACDNGTAPTVFGATSGKGGAVREFTQWLCRTSNAQQTINPVTGQGYRSAIVTALNLEGFQQVPASRRTAGYACEVLT